MLDDVKKILNKKNIINLLLLAILIVGIPFTVDLARRQQILNSRATGSEVVVLEQGCVKKTDAGLVATCLKIPLSLTSNFGPPTVLQAQNRPSNLQSKVSLIPEAYALDCTPGDSTGECKNNKGTGHKYCVYDPDGNSESSCIIEACWAGGTPGGNAGGPSDGSGCNNPPACWNNGGWVDKASADNGCKSHSELTGNIYCSFTDRGPFGDGCQGTIKTADPPSAAPVAPAPGPATKKELDEPCTVDTDCKSNNCPSNPSNPKYHKCASSDPGSPPAPPADDSSNACSNCGLENQNCCDGANKCTPGGSGAGSRCKDGLECTSGTCKAPAPASAPGRQCVSCNAAPSSGQRGDGCYCKPGRGDCGSSLCGSDNICGAKNANESGGPLCTGGGGPGAIDPPSVSATTHFKIAESPDGLNNAPLIVYTSKPMVYNFDITAPTAGETKKTIWVKFYAGSTASQPYTTEINLALKNPTVIGISCVVDLSTNALTVTVGGSGFGATKGSGNISITDSTGNKVSDKLVSWSDILVQTLVDKPNVDVSQGKRFNVTVKNSQGLSTDVQSCTVGLSQLSLGSKLFCRMPNQHTQSNVAMTVVANEPGARSVKETVSIDASGTVTNMRTKLQSGKSYKIAIDAPKSLKRVVAVEASEGTTVVSNLSLPIGDIFPLDGGDGTINSADKSELNREWNLTGASSANRPGDFNQDGRVNSVDWACMRTFFNQQDDSDPTPDPLVQPNVVPIGVGTTGS